MSSTVTIEVPDEAVKFLGETESQFAREVLVAAVLRWFEEGRLSQGQSATILGMKRGEFFNLLDDRKVSPVQMTVGELEEDFRRG
jgi:predicted HTH domain antitoxin